MKSLLLSPVSDESGKQGTLCTVYGRLQMHLKTPELACETRRRIETHPWNKRSANDAISGSQGSAQRVLDTATGSQYNDNEKKLKPQFTASIFTETRVRVFC